jgi:hypothetical protein
LKQAGNKKMTKAWFKEQERSIAADTLSDALETRTE